MTRLFVKLGLGLVAILLAALLYLTYLAYSALPSYSGDVRIPGLEAPVQVRFGPHAVPTIEAASTPDLVRAQGFVVASERFWQMDLMRRVGRGRLAEVLGEDLLPVDRFFRTIGLGAAAERGVAAMPEAELALLRAYTDGVNAYLDHAAKRLPIEYLLAGFEPQPWEPADTLAIAEYMAWTLSFNLREELAFLRLAADLGPERAAELFPVDVGVAAEPPPAGAKVALAPIASGLQRIEARLASLGLPTPGPASNSWALTGDQTLDGKPLLANDPHLAPSMPGLWYELELVAPGLHTAGVALPGAPLVLIGHNQDLAWGFTTTIADTQDLFLERPGPDGTWVERPGGQRAAVSSVREQIRVRGREEPAERVLRSTDLGIIINEILGAPRDNPIHLTDPNTSTWLALRWNLELPATASAAVHALNRARTLAEARAAALQLRHTAQNLIVATGSGDIGWQTTGRLPERLLGTGKYPLAAWLRPVGWSGYVDTALNPGGTNPASGRIVNANHRNIPLDYPVVVSGSWLGPFRARRIDTLLDELKPLSTIDMHIMQTDRVSLQACLYVDAYARDLRRIRQRDAQVADLLERVLLPWDGEMAPNSRSAAFYLMLRQALFEALLGDELGDGLEALLALDTATYGPLDEAMRSGESSFWDDVSTPQRSEDRIDILIRAARVAQGRLGDRTRLDQLRFVRFPHAFDSIPVLGSLFSLGPYPAGGGDSTINVAKASPDEPGKVRFLPSMRVVYTPGDWRGTRGTLPTGQSGHLLSAYRTDQLDDWLSGRSHAWPWNGPTPEDEIGRMRLIPAN